MLIMIVDDHDDMRRMIRSVVERELGRANRIVEFSGGEEAVRSAERRCPDLLLLDIELRSMNGFDVMERIRAVHPSARVIFITSHNASAYRTKARLMHAAGFVPKDHLSDLSPLLLSLQTPVPKGGSAEQK